MASLSDISFERYICILLGPPLVGKTVLASQFPSPFFLDLDNKLMSVKTLSKKQGTEVNFDVIQIDDGPTEDEDFIRICGRAFVKQSAWKKTKKAVEMLAKMMPKDSTIVLDNTSRASEFLIDDIKKATGRDKLQIQDWGTFVEEMQSLVNFVKFKGAKCNAIFISHEEYTKDELSGELMRTVLMPTKMKYRIPSLVNEFLRLETRVKGPRKNRSVVRTLRSVPDGATATGSQALIPDIENPTYKKIKPYLESALDRELPEPTWTPET